MKQVLKWVVCVAVFFLAWYFFPDIVRAEGEYFYVGLFAAGTVLWLVNMAIRPVVKFLSLPVTLVTLGLFGLIVNALMVELAAWLVPGMAIVGLKGFIVSVGMAILVSLLNVVLVKKGKK
ncbi:MAG: phage holin family protein [Peptococcaceae bacterium]|jgi:putative membrane protein|nr:phage holin family protein [Peptococcaceae bacterium]MDR2736718.1 phage holin family protein [Gracilibacteraceae bacterium]